MKFNVNSTGSMQNFILHPLIHTSLRKSLAQNVGGVLKRPECRLKYVMHTMS
jgi:hypothetical protein